MLMAALFGELPDAPVSNRLFAACEFSERDFEVEMGQQLLFASGFMARTSAGVVPTTHGIISGQSTSSSMRSVPHGVSKRPSRAKRA